MSTLKSEAEVNPLTQTVSVLRGVGPEREAQLGRLGVRTVLDLLLHKPRRYEDRRQFKRIGDLQLGELTTVYGQIVALGVKRFARGRKSVFEIIVDDGTARLHCRWWNLPYMQSYFAQGDQVLIYGKPNCLKPRTIDHPETEVVEQSVEPSIHLGRIAPVYPSTEGLPQRWLRSMLWKTLEQFSAAIPDLWPSDLTQGFYSRARAIQSMHFPVEFEEVVQTRNRLALDELIDLQLTIHTRRVALVSRAQGCHCSGDNHLMKPFLARLPFQLTTAQKTVLRDLRQDLASGRPMRRLLQGDVGSGKTVVAAACALMAVESGFQVAVMAPTEILAEQHYRIFRNWFTALGVPIELRTGSQKNVGDSSGQVTMPLASMVLDGNAQSAGTNVITAHSNSGSGRITGSITVGTHALIEKSMSFENLGLVIIDEQHRFGVIQREQLVRKGKCPHLLVMTATPIPRSLGLTLYGDLDLSVLNELPRGRAKLKTFVRDSSSLAKVWAFVRTQLEAGRQAFVVLPRVEDSGPGVKAVTKEFENLKGALAPYQVGMLHGRLRSEQKQEVLDSFRAGATAALLSTSLIEVGIDVPNATVMVVENAEQFGLAQLHQIRGRIGRGQYDSYCILVTDGKNPDSRRRLEILAETNDGFRIAEADMTLRGPGDFLGQEQSGLPPFRFVDLQQDIALVERARGIAVCLLELPKEKSRS